MARSWALCWVCGLLLASEAWSAAPPTPMDMRQVRIDLLLAKVRLGAVTTDQRDTPEAAARLAWKLMTKRGVDGVELLSRPCMITLNGQEGQCMTGQDVPVPFRDGEGVVRVKPHPVGVGARLMPTLLGGGRIRVEAEPTLCYLRANSPRPHTVRVSTTKDISCGETCAVVSLPFKDEVTTVSAVPVLSLLPRVGPLFRAATKSEEEFELLMLFTAREFRRGEDVAAAPKAWTAAAPKPQVRIDLVVARAPRREFAFASLDQEGLREYRRRLEMGVREGRVKIDAEPRLITQSGDPASYFAGSEHPFKYRDAAGQLQVRREEAGTRVRALPTVRRDGQVSLELDVGSSRFCEEDGYPTVATSQYGTTGELKPGQSWVVVIQDCGEPGEEERDLVVLCTPTVVRTPPEGE